jgi:hypothetical protein
MLALEGFEMNRNTRKVLVRCILVGLLLSPWIIIASCDDRSLEGAPNELIAELAFTPERVVQGEKIVIEMLVWNNTKKEIVLDCGCCWRFRLFTSEMQELAMTWPCPTVVCLPMHFRPGEQRRYTHRFAALVADESWPSDNGNLPIGKYIVRAGYGDLFSDDNPCPWAQGAFWVIKKE